MPRKLANSTKLVMLARCTLLAAVHRMSASSTKSMSMLKLMSRHGLCSEENTPSPLGRIGSSSSLGAATVVAIRSGVEPRGPGETSGQR